MNILLESIPLVNIVEDKDPNKVDIKSSALINIAFKKRSGYTYNYINESNPNEEIMSVYNFVNNENELLVKKCFLLNPNYSWKVAQDYAGNLLLIPTTPEK